MQYLLLCLSQLRRRNSPCATYELARNFDSEINFYKLVQTLSVIGLWAKAARWSICEGSSKKRLSSPESPEQRMVTNPTGREHTKYGAARRAAPPNMGLRVAQPGTT